MRDRTGALRGGPGAARHFYCLREGCDTFASRAIYLSSLQELSLDASVWQAARTKWVRCRPRPGRRGGGPPAALSSPDMGSETGRAISPTPGNRPSSSCGLAAAPAAILEGANPNTHRHTRPEGRCESSGPERIV